MSDFEIYSTTGELIAKGNSTKYFSNFIEDNKSNLYMARIGNSYLKHADLSNADLKKAYLRDADLRRADLRNADLSGSDLSEAELNRADLRNSDLRDANLSNSNLSNADLSGADLRNANLKGASIPIYSKWNICFCPQKDSTIKNISIEDIQIKIGCEAKTLEEWDAWFAGTEEFETPRHSFEFKQVEAMYKAYKAYILHLWGEE